MDRFDEPTEEKGAPLPAPRVADPRTLASRPCRRFAPGPSVGDSGPGLSRRQLLGRVGGGLAGVTFASLGLGLGRSATAAPGPLSGIAAAPPGRISLRALLQGCDTSRGIRRVLPIVRPYTSIRAVANRPAGDDQDLCVKHFRAEVNTQDWAPIGGWIDLVVKGNGDFKFSGHMHNSGFVNIHYALGALITTPSANGDKLNGLPFAHEGAVDGTVTLLGRERDDDWSISGNQPEIAAHWGEITQGRLFWSLKAQDTLSRGIQGLIEDIAKDAIKALAKAAVEYLIKAVIA